MADTKKAKDLGKKLIDIASELDACKLVKQEIVKPTSVMMIDAGGVKVTPLSAMIDADICDGAKQYIAAQLKQKIDKLDKQLESLLPR